MATIFRVALWRPFLIFAKIQNFNCQLSFHLLWGAQLMNWIKWLFQPFTWSLIRLWDLLSHLGYTRPFCISQLWNQSLLAKAFRKYTTLHVMINLKILFWEISRFLGDALHWNIFQKHVQASTKHSDLWSYFPVWYASTQTQDSGRLDTIFQKIWQEFNYKKL